MDGCLAFGSSFERRQLALAWHPSLISMKGEQLGELRDKSLTLAERTAALCWTLDHELFQREYWVSRCEPWWRSIIYLDLDLDFGFNYAPTIDYPWEDPSRVLKCLVWVTMQHGGHITIWENEYKGANHFVMRIQVTLLHWWA